MSSIAPPANHDTEAVVLGLLLEGHADTHAAIALLDGDVWARSAHAAIYRAILTVLEEHRRIEPTLVFEQLTRTGTLEQIGGAVALHELVAKAGSSWALIEHARTVADLARRRRIIDTSRELATRASDLSADVDAAVEAAGQALTATGQSAAVVTSEDVWPAVLDRIGAPTTAGASTGLAGMDERYTIVPGALTVVTGVPGSGKSELVDAIALHLARYDGWRFAVYSPENEPVANHVVKWIHSLLGARPVSGLFDAEKIDAAGEWLDEHVWWMRSSVVTDLDAILAQTRWLARRHGVRGLILDPWNKATWTRLAGESTTEAIGRHLAKVVRFARTESVHVWLIAHPTKLERDVDGVTRVATAYDIAHSAEFYNQADAILSVWRDQYQRRLPREIVEVHVQKIREEGVWGSRGMVRLRFDPATRRYHAPTGIAAGNGKAGPV